MCKYTGLLALTHPKDVERLKNDREWVRRFLLHHDMDKDKALNMILSTLKWRQKVGANGECDVG